MTLLKAIKSKNSDLYLVGVGEWTTDIFYARKFSTSADLVCYAEDRGMKWEDIEEVPVDEPALEAASDLLAGIPTPTEATTTDGNVHAG
jgi:hypothetical protein